MTRVFFYFFLDEILKKTNGNTMTGMMTLLMLITEIIHEIYGNLKWSFASNIGKAILVSLKDPGFVSFIYECEY